MATKIIAAHTRLFKNVFVCRKCSLKVRTEPQRIIEKKIICRRCMGHNFRPVSTKKK